MVLTPCDVTPEGAYGIRTPLLIAPFWHRGGHRLSMKASACPRKPPLRVNPVSFSLRPDGVRWPLANHRRQENTMPIELSHDHVAIRAVDYAGTVAWYRDKLDFTVDQEWP